MIAKLADGATLASTNGHRGAKRTPSAPKAVQCGLYVRVSTDQQAAQEFSSLDAQESVLRKLVADRNTGRMSGEPEWTIVQVFREKASAKDTNRPEFQKMLTDIREGRINMIVFIRLDRFSRSLRDFLDLQDFLKDHNCGYVSRYDPILDTSSPHGELMVRLMLLFAEYERKMIATRTREKVVAARQAGRWTGGFPPLGYDVQDGKLVVNEDEVDQLRAIFALYLEKLSMTATVTELNRRGWQTKSWITKEGNQHDGHSWSKATLQRHLTNRVYLGEIPCGKESYPGTHTPIIDEKLFHRVAESMTHGRVHGPAATRNSFAYLLRGLVFCKACSSAMVPATTKKGKVSYRYYRCTSVDRKGKDACPVRYAPAEPLEEYVVNHLRQLGRDPALVEEVVKEAEGQIVESLARLSAEKRRLEAEGRRVQAEARQVMKAKGSLASVELAALEERQGRFEVRLQEIEAEARKLKEARIDPEEAKKALETFDGAWEVLEAREKELIVRSITARVNYANSTSTVTILPGPLLSRQSPLPLLGFN